MREKERREQKKINKLNGKLSKASLVCVYVCVGIVYIRLILCHSIVSNAFSFYAPYIHAKITVSSDSIDLVNVWLSREREEKKNGDGLHVLCECEYECTRTHAPHGYCIMFSNWLDFYRRFVQMKFIKESEEIK